MVKFVCRVCGGNEYHCYKIGDEFFYCCLSCSTLFKDVNKFNLPIIEFMKLVNKEYAEPRIPRRNNSTDTGYDLFSIESKTIKPKTTEMIKTGIAIKFPKGFGAEIRPRSGLAYKHDIMITNSPGTIDSEYRNEIRVLLYNGGSENYIVNVHDRIAQLVLEQTILCDLKEVESFNDITNRGLNGFGSSGK